MQLNAVSSHLKESGNIVSVNAKKDSNPLLIYLERHTMRI